MYYIIENQIRLDGQVNTSTTARQTFASGLSYYHERYSKMVMTDLYDRVALMLVDHELNVIERAIIDCPKPEEENE